MKSDKHRPPEAGRGEAVYYDRPAAPEPSPLTPAIPGSKDARAAVRPITAEALARCVMAFDPDADLESMKDSLLAAHEDDPDNGTLLFYQARLLDALFHRLLASAVSVRDHNGEIYRDYTDRAQTDLALRAQRQCRSTVEALTALRRTPFSASPLEREED